MTNLPTTTKIINTLDNGWLTIAFNSPENKNALGAELTADLISTLHAVRDDRSVRGITLRGHGGVFCAGGDLKSFAATQASDQSDDEKFAAMAQMNYEGGQIFKTINEMPQVVIALVEGAAIAGGLGMVCCADMVAVTRDAKFALTETAIGIVPAQIAPHVVRRLGLRAARKLMLAAAKFNGAASEEYGLADYIADDVDGLNAWEQQQRKNVMKCAPNANALTKDILLNSHLQGDEMMRYAAKNFTTAFMGSEGKEGIASFIQKRKPSWDTSD